MTTPAPPDGRPLIGTVVRLDRARHEDAAALFAALDDERVYAAAYHGGARPRDPAEIGEWVTEAERDGRVMYLVRPVVDSALGRAGTVIGTSSLGEVDLTHRGLHLGWTAYTPGVWGGVVNPECKFLLLRHVFEDCGFERVKIQTDHINSRSQAAITRLGAVREGVLRHHRLRADGSWRDTVVFSILAAEWPAVRAGLEQRIGRATPSRG